MVVHPMKSKVIFFRRNNRPLPVDLNVFLNENEAGLADPSNIHPINIVTKTNLNMSDRCAKILGVFFFR